MLGGTVAGFPPGTARLVSEFSHKPTVLSRMIWSLFETFGVLRRGYLAALTDGALLDKAEYFIRLDQHAKAQKALDALARRPMEEPKLLAALANLELRNGNKEVARRAQLRAAQAYLRRGAVDDATHVLQQILALSRDCLEARLALGQIAEGRYEHEEAVIHYVEAVKILTTRQDWSAVQELLERVRQLQRVKTVLDGETQMQVSPVQQLGPGYADDPTVPSDRDITRPEIKKPVARHDTDPSPLLLIGESETLANVPSPVRGMRRSQAPSTVVVEPDLFDPESDATVAMSPVTVPKSNTIPSTFVRKPPPQAPSAASVSTAKLSDNTDIVIRDLPAEVLIALATAVDFKPDQLPLRPTPSGPAIVRGARGGNSVWDRAIVQGTASNITLNVGPEPDPEPARRASTPSILQRATTGISSVLGGLKSGGGKDGNGPRGG